MALRRVSIWVSLGVSVVFSLGYLFSFFNLAEDKIYDLFLRLRPPRERIDHVVFLDVDDLAVAHVGVFPWPRSVMADCLLRLKEYGAAAAVFDIEYIDKSPTEVDEVYLKQAFRFDYERRFADIGAAAADLLSSIGAGYIRGADASDYIGELTDYIAGERDGLYRDILGILRDNDAYLGAAAALFGRAWGTLNLQEAYPLTGEQAERRALAQERFSYPVMVRDGAPPGDYVDVLPAIPLFMEAVRGAGFTNVRVDDDGIRRRIFLARKVLDHWYVQLAFAPLLEFLGDPALELGPRQLVLKGAMLPGASLPADLVIPLDKDGAMMLDWPLTGYDESFTHLSFARFSYLEEYYVHIKEYLYNLRVNKNMFPDLVQGAETILAVFAEAEEAKKRALENTSGEDFEEYVRLREEAFDLIGELLNNGGEYLHEVREGFAGLPEYAAVRQEAEYNETLLAYIKTELDHTRELHRYLKAALAGKFCVLGRVDTGTTDIGVNPFHSRYVNVGTHGVVLDTILSRSFLVPLSSFWSILLTFLLVPGIIIGLGRGKPALRLVLGICGVLFLILFSLALFVLGGIFLGPLGPALALIAALILRESIAFVGSEREKQFIRKAFSTYLSGVVVQEILKDPGKLQLGGTKRQMTAIFTDLRKFSSIAEKIAPEDLVTLLNDYFSAMSNVVLEQGGTIDKYEGDAIVAFFGAPLEMEDHALRAGTSAILMKRLEKELNRKYAETGLSPAPLYTRFGINTGTMVVGNMGTQTKMDYTIMGNEVNLAARLEGVNKQYQSWILASESTVKSAPGRFISRRLDRVRVVGINEPVRLYELLALSEDAAAPLLKRVELFHHALDILENQDWTAAEAAFLEVLNHAPGDGPAKVFLNRCRLYRERPPKHWDGVFNLTAK
ncbi:MAG: CHASE2 domain-containing protein [Spirochaetaceae bacterium]|jgi:adenylate cyclase|nr:CHASE2 domain-containing protein [Spirochaetaceae bacterium]